MGQPCSDHGLDREDVAPPVLALAERHVDDAIERAGGDHRRVARDVHLRGAELGGILGADKQRIEEQPEAALAQLRVDHEADGQVLGDIRKAHVDIAAEPPDPDGGLCEGASRKQLSCDPQKILHRHPASLPARRSAAVPSQCRGTEGDRRAVGGSSPPRGLAHGHGKTDRQSARIDTTSQPADGARSSALSSRPTGLARS